MQDWETFWNRTLKPNMQEASDDVETWSAAEAWRSVIRICLHVFAGPWIPSIFRVPASCARLFLRPWCLNSHSALHIASFSKRRRKNIFISWQFNLAWVWRLDFVGLQRKGRETHLQSIYKGRYGLELALACVNEQHWMDLVGWGTKEDINSVLAPFSGS